MGGLEVSGRERERKGLGERRCTWQAKGMSGRVRSEKREWWYLPFVS